MQRPAPQGFGENGNVGRLAIESWLVDHPDHPDDFLVRTVDHDNRLELNKPIQVHRDNVSDVEGREAPQLDWVFKEQ